MTAGSFITSSWAKVMVMVAIFGAGIATATWMGKQWSTPVGLEAVRADLGVEEQVRQRQIDSLRVDMKVVQDSIVAHWKRDIWTICNSAPPNELPELSALGIRCEWVADLPRIPLGNRE